MVTTVKISASIGRKIPGDGTIYLAQSIKSPKIGECVYCGSKANLSDEHTIPYSLFGVATLRDGSCRDCAQKTQSFEQRLIQGTFKQAREFMSFPSRKSRKRGRWSGTREVIDLLNKEQTTRPLGEGVIPLCLAFPDYMPRALTGEGANSAHSNRSVALINLNAPQRPMPSQYEDLWVRFNPADLERCVVKVALTEAIRVIDPTIRDPVLARFILDGSGDSSEFLGGCGTHTITNHMHQVFHQRTKDSASENSGYLTTVELFSFLPTPSYKVLIRPSASTE